MQLQLQIAAENLCLRPTRMTNGITGTVQVSQPGGEVIITNDGATILNKMTVLQPAAKMLVELAKSQVSASL